MFRATSPVFPPIFSSPPRPAKASQGCRVRVLIKVFMNGTSIMGTITASEL